MEKESPERKTKRVAFARRQFGPEKESRKLAFGCCGDEIGEKVHGRDAGMPAVEMEMREHPGRDPFKNLRFLVLIFFAA